jgi:hypothetical protein
MTLNGRCGLRKSFVIEWLAARQPRSGRKQVAFGIVIEIGRQPFSSP